MIQVADTWIVPVDFWTQKLTVYSDAFLQIIKQIAIKNKFNAVERMSACVPLMSSI